MVGNINTSSALAAFDKMEEKVLTMEAQADALNQLSTDNLEGKFALLENSSVDDDLAELKKELFGSFKRGELPPGRSVPTSKEIPFLNLELEKELNELRRRAKGY
uniref:VPS37 C-terminal domain-containing protein n=1 Tax=Glycine max TaxID=3847 RepID=C6TBX5_SOYBN|nr:unknown [Glycine max]